MAAFQWTLDPKDFMPEVDASIAKVTEEVAIEIFAGVIMRTPVRTGSLRASWRISASGEDVSTTTGGSPGAPLAAPTIPSSLGKLDPYPKIYVSNNQPYAGAVNFGTPKHAPVNMVELTLASLAPR